MDGTVIDYDLPRSWNNLGDGRDRREVEDLRRGKTVRSRRDSTFFSTAISRTIESQTIVD